MVSQPSADLRGLSESDLVARLAVAGLALPPALGDEVLSRGARAIAPLARMVRHAASWQAGGERHWAPIHATLLLGALAARHPTDTALDALCAAIDHHGHHSSIEFQEALPQLLGAIGPPMLPRLWALAEDDAADPDARWTALWALASAAAHGHLDVGELRTFLRDRLADDYEEWSVQAAAAEHLLDVATPEDREPLLAWLADAAAGAGLEDVSEVTFTAAEVEAACGDAPPAREVSPFRDWRDFYAPERLESRRRRANEQAEGDAWRAGLERRDPDTIQRLAALLTGHLTARQDELADPAVREQAADVASRMALWATAQGDPPTAWDGLRFREFLLDGLAMLEEAEDPEWLAAALDQTLPFVRHLEGRGLVTASDRAACEAVFAAERRGLIETAEVLASGDAEGVGMDPDTALAARVDGDDDPLGLYADEGAADTTSAPATWAGPDDENDPPVSQETRPGRNDPCPCGSGKKYKRCCSK